MSGHNQQFQQKRRTMILTQLIEQLPESYPVLMDWLTDHVKEDYEKNAYLKQFKSREISTGLISDLLTKYGSRQERKMEQKKLRKIRKQTQARFRSSRMKRLRNDSYTFKYSLGSGETWGTTGEAETE